MKKKKAVASVTITRVEKNKYKQVFEDRVDNIAERLGDSREQPETESEDSDDEPAKTPAVKQEDADMEEEVKEQPRRIVRAKRRVQ